MSDLSEHDYGFTFESDIDKTLYKTQYDDLKARFSRLRDIVIPLLDSLNQDTEKPMIRWSNRKATLDRMINEISELSI